VRKDSKSKEGKRRGRKGREGKGREGKGREGKPQIASEGGVGLRIFELLPEGELSLESKPFESVSLRL